MHFVPPELVDQENIMVNSEEPLKSSDQYLQVMVTLGIMQQLLTIMLVLYQYFLPRFTVSDFYSYAYSLSAWYLNQNKLKILN